MFQVKYISSPIIRTKENKNKKNHLKLTLNSDLNVGCPIPIDAGGCCKRFGPISGGLEVKRIGPTDGGGMKGGAVDGGNEVTFPASGGIG